MQAILDRVFVKRDEYEGKIITHQKMVTGTIVSIGPGIVRGNLDNARHLKERKFVEHWYPTSLKMGQRVCFSLDKGEEHEIEGEKIVVMREWDIAGVLEDEVPPADQWSNELLQQVTNEDIAAMEFNRIPLGAD